MPMFKEPTQHAVDLHLDGFGAVLSLTTASMSFQFDKSERQVQLQGCGSRRISRSAAMWLKAYPP